MTSSTTKTNRTTLQNNIRNKQQLYSRFNRRMCASNSPAERSFIKNEMNRICKELNTCSKQWKNCGFGNNAWITKNCSPKSSTSNHNSSSNHSHASSRSSSRSNTTGSRNTRGTTRSTTGKRTKKSTTTSSRKTTNNPWMFSFSR